MQSCSERSDYVIICHTGAGCYSTKREILYKQLCQEACEAAKRILETPNEFNIQIAVVEAMRVLEDNPITNAGIGSNLTMSGSVECEASIMCGESRRFGAIGAVSKLKNPIEGAWMLLYKQLKTPILRYGRYPPNILVGQGAESYCEESGLNMVPMETLIVDQRRLKYEKYIRLIREDTKKENLKRKHEIEEEERQGEEGEDVEEEEDNKEQCQDTVGVIVLEIGGRGRVVTGTSSGGIFLKYNGRLGQSCAYGAGCYGVQEAGVTVGAVTTGLGEQLMRTLLPVRTCEFLVQHATKNDADIAADFDQFCQTEFMDSPFVVGDVERTFGIIGASCQRLEDDSESTKSGRLLLNIVVGHSTEALCYGVLTSRSKTATSMSRKPADQAFTISSLGQVFR